MRNFINLFLIIIFGVTLFAQEIDTSKVDSFIKNARSELKLKTGLSIGIVIDNNIVFVKGYGFNNIDDKIKTTPDSPFYIASATKSFTAALVEILTEKDSLDIDVPISNYLPSLEFTDENLHGDLISIRDLLTHRSGILSLPSVIRTAYTGQHTNKKLLELYKAARFTTPEFKYGNDGYVLTSLILDSVYTKPWQQLMKENIFEPLQMKNTSCFISDFDKSQLRAYNSSNGSVEKLDFVKADNTMHAAGGIVSTVNDLCNWLVFNLNDGQFKDDQILSKRKIDEAHSSQIGCHVSFWKYYRYAYGLGWYLSEYNNEKLIHHFGGYAGARSHISFIPEHNIGVVALTNDDGDGFYVVDLVANYIYNLFLNKSADSIAEKELQVILNDVKESNNDEEVVSDTVVNTIYEESQLTGEFINNEYGEIEITNSNQLQLAFGNLKGELKPIDEKKYAVQLGGFNTKVEFDFSDGKISELIFYGPVKIIFDKK